MTAAELLEALEADLVTLAALEGAPGDRAERIRRRVLVRATERAAEAAELLEVVA